MRELHDNIDVKRGISPTAATTDNMPFVSQIWICRACRARSSSSCAARSPMPTRSSRCWRRRAKTRLFWVGQLGRNMRGDADHFNASIESVAPDCFEHQEELLRKHGATSLVVDLRNIHPAACADTAIELGAIAASRQPPCGWGRFRFRTYLKIAGGG